MQLFVTAQGFPCLSVSTSPTASVASVVEAYAHYQGLAPGANNRRVVYEGRTLEERCSLAQAGVAQLGTLQLLPRLLGGGGDGGSTGAESRSCYLEMYMGKKPDKVNPEEERLARWTTCRLTGMPLQPPCVCDELGSLFNKDSVIQALVGKTMPKGLSHITSLKHVFDLQLERSPEAGGNGAARSGGGGNGGAAAAPAVQFACPITGLALSGKYRFVVVRRTGHVLSERALKEVPQVVEELVGFKPGPAELIPVNPPAEELQGMREALLEARAAARAAKREKKKDKAGGAGAEAAAGGAAKRAAEGAGGGLYGGEAARGGAGDGGGAGKKFKAAELMPSHADKKVWESLFTSSRGDELGKESFLCRSTAARGMHLS